MAAGIGNITLDVPVITFLASGKLPTDTATHQCILRAAMKLHCDARGQLWAKDINGNLTCCIPAIGDREAIIKEVMANLLYPSGQRVYKHLGTRLFW